MSKKWITWILGALMYLSCSTAWAQVDSLLRQADRLLGYKAYGRAIEAYSQLLTDEADRLTPMQKSKIQLQLASAYRQVGDGLKAERYYREALSNTADDNPQQLLLYAQTLAGNGKFQEAQKQYERYLQLKDKQPATRQPLAGPSATTVLGKKKEPTKYRLENLDLNTNGEEFSPAYYQDGLVYVAGRKGGAAIETMGSGGGSGYLDLFYVPNRNNLKVASIINPDGSISKPVEQRNKASRQVGNYTRETANDSPTVPNYTGSLRISDGLGYQENKADNPSKRFSQTLNTKYHEGPATFSHDGQQIIFTRNNYNNGRAKESAGGVNKLKLYTAVQQDGGWKDIVELPFNSDEYSVGHPALNHEDDLLYFASDMPGGFGGTDLYVARFQNGRWSRPTNLGNTVNTKGNELFPFIDDAGNLYFASDGHKGLGGLDIFFATLTNGVTAQSIEHLDAPINSPQDDFGLITDSNRQGGYFSSNRREGNDDIYRFIRESSLYGCRDLTIRLYDTDTDQALDSVSVLVKSKGEGRQDQTLTSDANGYIRVCLEGDNTFVFKASRDGYISSTVGFTTRALVDDQPSRLEIGLIKPTIVMDTIPEEYARPSSVLTRSRIAGVVLSERGREPLEGVMVKLRNECDRTQREYITKADGRYSFDIVEGCDYTLIASKSNFGTNTNRIKRIPKKAKPKEVSADLKMLSVGDVVTIDNIYYDLDQASLRPDAMRELDKVVATMRKYPSLIIEIRSHTDSRGDAERNKAFSLQRAKEVANYLASKGISRRRMATIGMGESQLVNNCTDGVICTEAEHRRNRRTEFRVISIK